MPSPETTRPSTRGQGPPIQFTLRSMLIFMTISAVLLGVSKSLHLGFGVAFFAMGFILFMALLAGLRSISRSDFVVVYETATEPDAVLCCNYLKAEGIEASTRGGQLAGFVGAFPGAWQVVVWAEDADRASQLIEGKQPAPP